MSEAQPARWQYRFRNFSRAYALLREAAEDDPKNLTDLEREGLIQRFEYTFELAWKTLKDRRHADGTAMRCRRLREDPPRASRETHRGGWRDDLPSAYRLNRTHFVMRRWDTSAPYTLPSLSTATPSGPLKPITLARSSGRK